MDQNQTPKKIPAITADVVLSSDGKTAIGVQFAAPSLGKKMAVTLNSLTDELYAYAACHGIKQKCVDAAAMPRSTTNGASATVADKWAAVSEVAERLISGQWFAEREGGGGQSYLLRALCELKPSANPEKVAEWLKTKTKAERDAMELREDVKPLIEKYKAARADSDYDTDAALAELDNLQ